MSSFEKGSLCLLSKHFVLIKTLKHNLGYFNVAIQDDDNVTCLLGFRKIELGLVGYLAELNIERFEIERTFKTKVGLFHIEKVRKNKLLLGEENWIELFDRDNWVILSRIRISDLVR